MLDAGRARVAFTHPLFRAYFAAQHAARARESAALVAHVRSPRWQQTIRFYSAVASVAPLVRARLQVPDDLFHSNLLTVAAHVA